MRRLQQQSAHLFGHSCIFPPPPGIFAFPEILAFFILENSANTMPRAIVLEMSGKSNRNSPVMAFWHLRPWFSQFWLTISLLHIHNFFNKLSRGKNLCKEWIYFAFMTNLCASPHKMIGAPPPPWENLFSEKTRSLILIVLPLFRFFL